MGFLQWLFKERDLQPEQLNEHGQIVDRKILQSARYKFGFSNILYQSEEAGIGAVHTVIIRALGGTNFHLGICGGLSSIGSVVQWLGAFFLKRFKSNKKAMIAIQLFGASVAFLKCGILLCAVHPAFDSTALWIYMALGFLLAASSGIQWNIETNWVGDLVPREKLGWFSGVKWVVAVFGILLFLFFFGKMADLFPNIGTYAAIFFLVGVSHLAAILLVSTIPDRTPKNANFISSGETRNERLNYKSAPLWCYISFYFLWSGGRAPMYTFSIPYLLDQFHSSMTKVALILGIQSVVSMVMLLIMGKLTDKFGCRIPLIAVSSLMACCMLLWVASAWWGIGAIVAFQLMNGMAGHTHTLLATNYGLEIFPDKGRAGYFGFSRFIMGTSIMVVSVVAGYVLHCMEGWRLQLWGAELNHYHFLFFCCMLTTLCCAIPLLIAGKRRVMETGNPPV